MAQMVKNPSARRCRFDPWVVKIPWTGNGNPLNILAWGIPWTEPGRLQSIGSQKESDKI